MLIFLYSDLYFQLDTRFRGSAIPAMKGEPFSCTVKFEGPSVLEGVRELVKAGVMSARMPAHVRNLPFLGKNHVTLANRSDASAYASNTRGGGDTTKT